MQNEQYIQRKMFEIEIARIKEGQAEQSEKVDTSNESMLTIMESIADKYEESQERELTNMDVLATMYEEILSIKGEA